MSEPSTPQDGSEERSLRRGAHFAVRAEGARAEGDSPAEDGPASRAVSDAIAADSSESAAAASEADTDGEADDEADAGSDDEPELAPLFGDDVIRVRHKRKSRRGLRTAAIVLGVILGIVLVTAGAFALWVRSLDKSMGMSDEEKQALRSALVTQPKSQTGKQKAFYALILGSDTRDEGSGGENGRSDVTMLARIDPENYTVDLISIPRDTAVTINSSMAKINAAYSYGGAAAAVSTVSQFAGVDISHYVMLKFGQLENVVNTLGGVWVDVPESFSAGNGGMSFKAGRQLLNGEQALAFARERYNVSGGDFGRAQAQRLIVEAIIKQVMAAPATQIPGLVGQLAEAVTTDYSVSDMAALAMDFYGHDMKIYSVACPSYTWNVSGVSYVGTMYTEWRQMMQRVDAGLDPRDTSAAIPEAQQASERLGAATNGASPQDYAALAQNAMTTDDVAQAQQ